MRIFLIFLASADVRRVYVAMVDSVLACACDAALRRPSPSALQELAGCHGRGSSGSSASGGNAYTAAWERVSRLASSGVLLRWAVEVERVTIRGVLSCPEQLPFDSLYGLREGLCVLATLAPLELLAAAPGVLQ